MWCGGVSTGHRDHARHWEMHKHRLQCMESQRYQPGVCELAAIGLQVCNHIAWPGYQRTNGTAKRG